MCGIFGFAGSPDRQLLGRMAAAIVHRGPDDAGAFETPSVSLGHRRLSIIDREGGHQPVANEDETVWLVYNGEVYNYRELRAELEAAGHIFRTHCDTEVIVHAYEEWGAACAARFNGMWAFAIADLRGAGEDGRGGKLVLNRDHFGIKPLYYARSPQTGRLLFASEIKALLQDPELVAEPDEQMIFEYLQHGFHDHRAETFFKGVYHVPAATWIELPLGERRAAAPGMLAAPLESTAYWTPVLTHGRRRRPGRLPAPLPRERRAAPRLRGPRRLLPLRRPRLDDHRQLHERAAQGGRARRDVAARPAQDLQRRVRRRPHRRARVHRDRRREHRRRHHLHQPDVARVHRRAARLRLAPGRAHRQHRPLRAVVRDALRARAGHRAARRAGRRRADRRLRAVPARLPAPAAQGGQVRRAAQGGHGLARRAHGRWPSGGSSSGASSCRRASSCGRTSSPGPPTPGTGAPSRTSRSACSRTCSRTACRACCATRTATPWRSASRAGCRTSTRSSSTTS